MIIKSYKKSENSKNKICGYCGEKIKTSEIYYKDLWSGEICIYHKNCYKKSLSYKQENCIEFFQPYA